MIVVAGSMMLPLGACSRTSDGTIVMDKPVALPSINIMPAKPLVPSWMQAQAGRLSRFPSPEFPATARREDRSKKEESGLPSSRPDRAISPARTSVKAAASAWSASSDFEPPARFRVP